MGAQLINDQIMFITERKSEQCVKYCSWLNLSVPMNWLLESITYNAINHSRPSALSLLGCYVEGTEGGEVGERYKHWLGITAQIFPNIPQI